MQLAEMTKNQVLKWHLKLTMQHVLLRASLDNYSLERVDSAKKEHHLLVRKIKDKDIMGSVDIIRNHVREDRSYIIACLSENNMKDDSIVL